MGNTTEKPEQTEPKEEVAKINDFDDVFEYIGGWGPFQYLLTLAFFPFNIFLGYVYLSPILTLFPPPHWCWVPELAHLSAQERKELAIPRCSAHPSTLPPCPGTPRGSSASAHSMLGTGLRECRKLKPIPVGGLWEVVARGGSMISRTTTGR